MQKGYRCFSPDLKRYLVSPDVTFFETTSFFPSLECVDDSIITNGLPVSSTIYIPQVVSSLDHVAHTTNSPPPLLTYHRLHRPTLVTNPTTELDT